MIALQVTAVTCSQPPILNQKNTLIFRPCQGRAVEPPPSIDALARSVASRRSQKVGNEVLHDQLSRQTHRIQLARLFNEPLELIAFLRGELQHDRTLPFDGRALQAETPLNRRAPVAVIREDGGRYRPGSFRRGEAGPATPLRLNLWLRNHTPSFPPMLRAFRNSSNAAQSTI